LLLFVLFSALVVSAAILMVRNDRLQQLIDMRLDEISALKLLVEEAERERANAVTPGVDP
jgi:hypothetical protein